MAYTNLNYHFIFSTKQRKPVLNHSIDRRLFSYISGITGNMKSRLYIINGVCDHVHLLVSLSGDISPAEYIRTIKTNSCKWIHQNFADKRDFSWQKGYSAFTVSQSAVKDVYSYISGQQEHHKRIDFIDELKAFLVRHKIEYDPEYLQ